MIEPDTAEATQDASATAQRVIDLLLEVLEPLDASAVAEDEADALAELRQTLSQRDGEVTRDARLTPGSGSTPTLSEVSPQQEEQALASWFALNDLFDRLGPERLAAVDQQTNFRQLSQDILQAIDIHLDDPGLSSVGKILAIAQVLLGQRFTQQ